MHNLGSLPPPPALGTITRSLYLSSRRFGLSYTTFSLAWSPRPPPSVTGAGASIVLRGPKGATTYSVKVDNNKLQRQNDALRLSQRTQRVCARLHVGMPTCVCVYADR